MNKNTLKGAIFSIPMFFNEDHTVDYKALKNYLTKCLESPGVEVIFAMAYNTRYRQLSYSEIVEVSKLCCQMASSHAKKAIIGHPYTVTNSELLAYCHEVKQYNPYAISVLYPERYYGIKQAVKDFIDTPKQAGIPVLVHEQKLVSGFDGSLINWPEDLLTEVLSDDNVIAVKEDSKDDQITAKTIALSKKYHFDVIVAGGGKRRVRELIKNHGLSCWLNGSLMLFPELAKQVSEGYLNQDAAFMDWYEQKIESPYFDEFISKVGWHVGHKAALHYLGYCQLIERPPMPVLAAVKLDKFKPVLEQIRLNVKRNPTQIHNQ